MLVYAPLIVTQLCQEEHSFNQFKKARTFQCWLSVFHAFFALFWYLLFYLRMWSIQKEDNNTRIIALYILICVAAISFVLHLLEIFNKVCCGRTFMDEVFRRGLGSLNYSTLTLQKLPSKKVQQEVKT